MTTPPGGKPEPGAGFLGVPEPSAGGQRLADDDLEGLGYVMNASRLWAHLPDTHDGLFDLVSTTIDAGGLTLRQRGILIEAAASTLGDSYCSLAWGGKLADEAGAEVAAAVLRGDDAGLEPSEQALARWARQVARDPNSTDEGDVQMLREKGFSDVQILAITTFVALRLAFSTVNDALGARPDRQLVDRVPAEIRDAVTFGRPAAPAADGG